MRFLFLKSTEDYGVVLFNEMYNGVEIEAIMDNPLSYRMEFIEKHPDECDFELYTLDLDVSFGAFMTFMEFIDTSDRGTVWEIYTERDSIA